MITSEFKVKRFMRANSWKGWQILFQTWYLFGIPIWRKTVDREEIPQHILIQYATLGDCIGWTSKFAKYI